MHGLVLSSHLISSLSLYAVDKLELNVDRVVYGSLMTSLEMAGVSLTLLRMEPGWDHYIGRNSFLAPYSDGG